MAGLTREEMETIIHVHELDAMASVWTCQRRYITKLEALRKRYPSVVQLEKQDNFGGRWYKIPLEFVALRPAKIKDAKKTLYEGILRAGEQNITDEKIKPRNANPDAVFEGQTAFCEVER
jgi:hypothetical protein